MLKSQAQANRTLPFAAGVYAIVDAETLGLQWHGAGADWDHWVEAAASYAFAAVRGGAVALQWRCKLPAVPTEVTVACARAMRAAAGDRAAVFVNDDWPAAAQAPCGAHLGQSDGDVRAVAAAHPQLPLGWSTHSLAQIAAAQALPISYVGFGPVRATQSKANVEAATGWAQLQDACAKSAVPVVAIGGLQLPDAVTVRHAGAHAMAVIGAWLGPRAAPFSPAQAAQAVEQLAQAWQAAPRDGPRWPKRTP